jgi:hypothetical protein
MIRIHEYKLPAIVTITIKDGEMLNITAHIIAFPKPEMYWQFGQNGLCINVSSGITNSFNINRDIVEVITKHDKNTRIQTYSNRLGYYRSQIFQTCWY